ncbi:MAG: hypothetical protein IJB74_07495 [Clostridia bacterium]|nr:hypothetical protein [Clostridia bacterium]
MKTLKKSLSIVLSLFMILSCASAALAAKDYDHLPQIYIEGFESKQIYREEDTEHTDPLFFPINGQKMIDNLMKYEQYIKQAVSEGNPDLLYRYICLWMEDCFGLAALEKDGCTNKEGVVTEKTTLNYKGNGKYVFRHDCRLSPADIAKEFKEYVKWVQADSGSQKYELAASSFGASVALAFINEYPEERKNIDSLVFCVPSIKGVNFAGELFSGSFDIDPDALLAFISDMNLGEELTLFLTVLNKTGTLDAILSSFLEPALKVALLKALRTVVHDIFGTMPSMWSFVDERYFYDALEYIYGKNYTDPSHEYAGLISKIIYYHENIMIKAEDIILNAKNEGIKVSILSKYGDPPFPLSKEGNFTGDGFVALEMSSFGAVCAMNGEQLPADYVQAKDCGRNMISPDRTLDASTCLLPDNTWFIKGLWHGEKTDSYYDLINTVLYDDINVLEDTKYPQFLENDGNGNLVPMKEAPAQEKETSWLHDFLNLITKVIKIIIEKLRDFFGK